MKQRQGSIAIDSNIIGKLSKPEITGKSNTLNQQECKQVKWVGTTGRTQKETKAIWKSY